MSKEFQIEPQKETPKVDTSKWPILLKNYDSLNIRQGNFIVIPQGSSPLKRPLQEYLK
jgi:H/ACA ribonucleoprotein complex subunit 4